MSDTDRLQNYIITHGLKIRLEGRVVRLVERNTSRHTGRLVIREINSRRKRVKILLSA